MGVEVGRVVEGRVDRRQNRAALEPERVVLPTELVLRESSGPAPVS